MQDITQQRAIRWDLERQVAERTAELERKNAELKHSNDELSQYAYVTSHDLQEPLRKIRMYISWLCEKFSMPPESAEILQKITKSSARMTQLIIDGDYVVEGKREHGATSLDAYMRAVVPQPARRDAHLGEDAEVADGIPLRSGAGVHARMDAVDEEDRDADLQSSTDQAPIAVGVLAGGVCGVGADDQDCGDGADTGQRRDPVHVGGLLESALGVRLLGQGHPDRFPRGPPSRRGFADPRSGLRSIKREPERLA